MASSWQGEASARVQAGAQNAAGMPQYSAWEGNTFTGATRASPRGPTAGAAVEVNGR